MKVKEYINELKCSTVAGNQVRPGERLPAGTKMNVAKLFGGR